MRIVTDRVLSLIHGLVTVISPCIMTRMKFVWDVLYLTFKIEVSKYGLVSQICLPLLRAPFSELYIVALASNLWSHPEHWPHIGQPPGRRRRKFDSYVTQIVP